MQRMESARGARAPLGWRRMAGLAAILGWTACAGFPQPSATDRAPASGAPGFRIQEEARFGMGVRSDFRRAMALLEQGRTEAAVELLVEVTREAPDATAAHVDLGMVYAQLDQLDEAASSLEAALELHPRHPVAHNELGIVRRRQGRFDEAREHYEAALEFYPGFLPARRNLAILCDLYLGDLACAIDHYERVAAAAPEDQKVSMWIADLRRRSGE